MPEFFFSRLAAHRFSLKSNLLANFAGNTLTSLLTLVFAPLYLHYIGIEAFGLIGFFLSFQSLVSLLDFGLGVTVNRELALRDEQPAKAQESRDLTRTLEILYWAAALLLGIVAVALSPVLAEWVNPQQLSRETVTLCFAIMSVGIAFQFPTGLYLGGLLGLQRQVLLAVVNIFFGLLKSVGALAILRYVSPTPQFFFLWQTIVAAVQVFTMGALLRLILPKGAQAARFRKSFLAQIWRFTTGISGISVLAVLITQIDKVVLGRILSLKAFGYYSLAGLIANSLYRLTVPISQACFPKMSQLVGRADEKKLRRIYHQGCQITAVVIFPVAAVFAFFSSEIVFLWQRNEDTTQNVFLLVSLLIIGAGLNSALVIPYALQLANNWTKLHFYTLAAGFLLIVLLIIILVPYFGAAGAAAAWIILNLAFICFEIPLMHQRLLPAEKWNWYWRDFFVPLFAAFTAALAARFLFVSKTLPILVFFQLATVYAAVFGLTLLATDYTRRWIAEKFKSFFSKTVING